MTASKSSSGIVQTREELLSSASVTPAQRPSTLLPKFGGTGERAANIADGDNPAAKLVEDLQRLNSEAALQSVRSPTHSAEQTAPAAAAANGRHGRDYAMTALKRHPWNARWYRSPERVRALALELAADGQRSPICVAPDPAEPGTYFIIDGDTRFLSAKSLHWDTLWGMEVDVDLSSPLDVYASSYKATASTVPISSVDQAIRWHELIEGKFATLDDIANELGRSKTTISNMMAYRRLPEPVLEFISENIEAFPFSVAAELVRVSKDQPVEAVLALCKHVTAENVSRRGLEDAAKRVFGQDGERRQYNKRKQTQISLDIRHGENAIGKFRTFDTGAIEFKIVPEANLPEGARDHIASILKIVAEAAGKDDVVEMKQMLQARLREME